MKKMKKIWKKQGIKLTVNGNEIFVRLDDNVASKELLEMLPLTLTLKILIVQKKLQLTK